MQSNITCSILEQYLSYLGIIKGRSLCTIKEYRTDVLSFLWWVVEKRGMQSVIKDFAFVDADLLTTITLSEMYAFVAFCQRTLNASPGTRARKIVSIRQFWKHLKKQAFSQITLLRRSKHPNNQNVYQGTCRLKSLFDC